MKTLIPCIFAIPVAILVAVPAQAEDFTGPRVEAHLGWERTRFAVDDRDIRSKKGGMLFGVGAGYDFAISKGLIAGIEANFDLSRVEGRETAGALILEHDMKRDIEVSGRLGAQVAPSILLYAKAGYSRARDEEKLSVTATTGVTTTATLHKQNGFRVGAGVEMALAQGIYLKSEYRYSNYGDDLKRHQMVAGVGIRF